MGRRWRAGVRFAPLHSALVAVPATWIPALLEAVDAATAAHRAEVDSSSRSSRVQPVGLRLSWTCAATPPSPAGDDASSWRGETAVAWVAWSGGPSSDTPARRARSQPPPLPCIELDPIYAAHLGLTELDQVDVELLDGTPPAAATVAAEPLTPADWEILELNAGAAEAQFLNQIRFVWPGQVVPIWLTGRSHAALRIVNVDGPQIAAGSRDCAMLGLQTDVAIAPKLRQRPRPSTQQKQPAAQPPFNISVRLQPPPGCPSCAAAQGVPTFPDPGVALLDFDSFPALAVRPSPAGTPGAGSPLYAWLALQPPPPTLRPHAPENRGAERPPILAPGGAASSSSSHARPALRSRRPGDDGPTDSAVTDVAADSEAEENLWAHHKMQPFRRLPLRSTELPAEADRAAPLRVHLELLPAGPGDAPAPAANADALGVRLQALAPLAVTNDSIVLLGGSAYRIHIGADNATLAHDEIVVLTADALQHAEIELLPSSSASRSSPDIYCTCVPTPLGGMDSLLREATDFLLPALTAPLHMAKTSASSLTPGLLVHGARGCGKTLFVTALRRSLAQQGLAHSVEVECRELAQKRADVVRKRLKEAFVEAGERAPALVVLESLDAVCPAVEAQGGEGAPGADPRRSSMFAHLLAETLAAAQAVGRPVALVATSPAAESVHAMLLGTHVLSRRLLLPAPDAAQRAAILRCALASRSRRLAVHPSLLAAAGARTDGFGPADLMVLVERLLQQAVVSHMQAPVDASPEADGDEAAGIAVGEAHLEAALSGLVPEALRGIPVSESTIAWTDIGGLAAVKRTLKETFAWPARYPRLFAQSPLRLRSGILLYGPPGCGKTLLASAVARECGLRFISTKGPELLNKYIGASEQAVRSLFERAQAARPCILFFDEFDSIAPRRGHDSTGVTDRVVNQFLTYLDGCEGLQGVYVLAATSRPDMIDQALLRPGRLDKALHCPLPSCAERQEILEALGRQAAAVAADVDFASLAASTPHFSGADLRAIITNAQLILVHERMGEHNMGEAQGDGLQQDEQGEEEQGEEEEEEGEEETVLCLGRRHLKAALAELQPSVSAQDREFYERIHREFSGGGAAMVDGADVDMRTLTKKRATLA